MIQLLFLQLYCLFSHCFVGALQGTRTLEGNLKQMADSFNLPFKMKMFDLYFPHIFSYIFPAWISALGMAWKIVVMAELLSANDGIGSALAITEVLLILQQL